MSPEHQPSHADLDRRLGFIEGELKERRNSVDRRLANLEGTSKETSDAVIRIEAMLKPKMGEFEEVKDDVETLKEHRTYIAGGAAMAGLLGIVNGTLQLFGFSPLSPPPS